ncbi:MAG: aldehyde ferredoxin oxidoreductase family protein [Candidatus Asgardarchaeia archaeon]
MKGWTGKILRVDLTKKIHKVQEYPKEFALNFIGGRGFAAKILWDELKPGVDPLSPENKFIVALGPLSGFAVPNAGKVVVAAKSPLTGGYGDGNTGSFVAVHLRKAGYDAMVVEGAADKPVYIYIEDDKVEINSAEDLWGLTTNELHDKLEKMHGKSIGALTIGPAGENLVKFAIVRSMYGRAGGRPGMGTVMGSKKLKAIVVRGTKEIPAEDPDELKRLGIDGFKDVRSKPLYESWMKQGTMMVHSWCQENSVLPTYNFREGQFEHADKLSGDVLEKLKVKTYGCPNCNMQCGHVIIEVGGKEAELDYENIGMLGSNIGISDLKQAATLNLMADEYGLDTISLGSVIAFAMESSEKKVIDDGIEWGDFEAAKKLTEDITYRRGIGDILAEGTKRAAEKLGKDAINWAIQVKGLEVSAYDCHYSPGMALSYGTSPIGAHHKDAWVISWEIQTGRESYTIEKVDKVIELQRIRGGLFESIVSCRLPWVELGFDLEWYVKYFKAATGVSYTLDDFYKVADRIYNVIRAFWVREYGNKWGRHMDMPPVRWFKEPLTVGPFKGKHLDEEKYQQLLTWYYERRGWDERGIPKRETLVNLGLSDVADELSKYVALR